MAVRLAGTNLSHHQERQLADSQLCIVLKGVPQTLTEGREKYRDMAVAFSRAMGEIKLGGDIQPKLLQRISKRKEDRSGRSPHLRVELQSLGHKVLIFDHVRLFKESNRAPPSFSVAPDIPKYALRRHNTLQKISQIAREKHPELHTRVCIKNKKWPELQLKNAKGEWKLFPETTFEPARAEFNKRSRDESERKKARKAASQSVPMETASSQARRLDPRTPSASTPAQTRSARK